MTQQDGHVAPLRLAGFLNRLAASPRFQAFAARVPVLRGVARREGAALFDIMQGFVNSQMLAAMVELRVLHCLAEGGATPDSLAARLNVPPERMAVLLQAGAAMRLLQRKGSRFYLAQRGAAFLGVAGLEDMVRHHAVLYGDLADPVAFVRGETTPALANFWPYVFGASGPMDPEISARYSRLMSDSQTIVAQEALAVLSLKGVSRLLDVGGGTGAFLRAVRAQYPALELALFDLPDVVSLADLPVDVARHGGSFRHHPLPQGADVISLVRVLYDHSDDTVRALLAKVFDALPAGGKVLVVEPMSGGARPDRHTDVYFSVYTMAMQTGRTRSAQQICTLLKAAGYANIRVLRTHRPYIAGVVSAQKL